VTAPALGPLLVLTDRVQAAAAGRTLTDTVAMAVAGGARAVVLREKDLPAPERAEAARALVAVLDAADGALLVASDLALAHDVGAAGVHLAAADAFPTAAERAGAVVGVSAHGADDVRAAAEHGADYVTLSPIFPSASKPGYGPALGTAALAGHSLPVYALGGVDAGDAAACLRAGAAGVATMGAVMAAADPARAVADLLDAIAARR
jgi:thiamine-phosphate pyrophosphorylase